MPNVLITTQGLQYVLSAHDSGVYVDLRYFVPVYDDRIDPNVRDDAVLSAFSQIADNTATEPYGEKIWNVSGYSLSDNNDYLISASALVGGLMTDTYQKTQVATNTFSATPLSNQVSGTGYGVSAGSQLGLYDWTVTTPAGVAGDNSRPTSTSSDYFLTKDYYPVYDSSAANRLRGAFKMEMAQNVGKFKFNKLALYAVQVDNVGTVLGEAFFGEAYLSEPVVKTSLAEDGFDNFIFDIQIDLSGTSATWDEVFFSSSADYWSHSPGGLYYPGKIGVGQFEDNTKELSATAHLRKPRDISGNVDQTSHILRMDYDNDKFFTFDVTSATAETGVSVYDLVVGNQLFCGGNQEYCGSIRPEAVNSIGLGTWDYPFHHLVLNDYFHLKSVLSATSTGLITNSKSIEIQGTAKTGNFVNGDLVANDDFSDSSEGYHINSLLIRTNRGDNDYCGDVFIVAGAKTTGSWPHGGSITHRKILEELQVNEDFETNFWNDDKLFLVAKGGTKLYGSFEMENNRDNFTVDGRTYSHVTSQIFSKSQEVMLFSRLKPTVTLDNISYWFSQWSLSWNGTYRNVGFSEIVNEAARLFLISDQIRTYGTILPAIGYAANATSEGAAEIANGVSDIGTNNERFATGYFNSLIAAVANITNITASSGNITTLLNNEITSTGNINVASSTVLLNSGGVASTNYYASEGYYKTDSRAPGQAIRFGRWINIPVSYLRAVAIGSNMNSAPIITRCGVTFVNENQLMFDVAVTLRGIGSYPNPTLPEYGSTDSADFPKAAIGFPRGSDSDLAINMPLVYWAIRDMENNFGYTVNTPSYYPGVEIITFGGAGASEYREPSWIRVQGQPGPTALGPVFNNFYIQFLVFGPGANGFNNAQIVFRCQPILTIKRDNF